MQFRQARVRAKRIFDVTAPITPNSASQKGLRGRMIGDT